MRLIFMSYVFVEYITFIYGNDDVRFKIHIPEVVNHHHHTKYVYVHKYGDEDGKSPYKSSKSPKQNTFEDDHDYHDIKHKSQKQNLFTPSYHNSYHHHSFDDGDGHKYSFTYGTPPKSELNDEKKPNKHAPKKYEKSDKHKEPPKKHAKKKEEESRVQHSEKPSKPKEEITKEHHHESYHHADFHQDEYPSFGPSFAPYHHYDYFETTTKTGPKPKEKGQQFKISPTFSYNSDYNYFPEQEYVSAYPALKKDFENYDRNKEKTERYIYPTVGSYEYNRVKAKTEKYVYPTAESFNNQELEELKSAPPTEFVYSYPSVDVAAKYESLDKDIDENHREYNEFLKYYDAVHDKDGEELGRLVNDDFHTADEYLTFHEDSER